MKFVRTWFNPAEISTSRTPSTRSHDLYFLTHRFSVGCTLLSLVSSHHLHLHADSCGIANERWHRRGYGTNFENRWSTVYHLISPDDGLLAWVSARATIIGIYSNENHLMDGFQDSEPMLSSTPPEAIEKNCWVCTNLSERQLRKDYTCAHNLAQ